MAIPVTIDSVLIPPRDGIDIGDYSLRDFAAKWMWQQADLAQLGRYRAANAALVARADPRARVVLMGDSITEFWTDADALAGPGWYAVNRGIAGQNAAQMLLRFQADAIDLAPRAVVLLCGTNDLRSYAGPPAALAEAALARIAPAMTSMADIATARGVAIALCTLPPVGRQPDTYRDPAAIVGVNRWIADFARARGVPLVDYHAALADAAGRLPAALSDDGVHPNPAGYARMMTQLSAVLAALGCTPDVTPADSPE